jgi:hypothetical protein
MQTRRTVFFMSSVTGLRPRGGFFAGFGLMAVKGFFRGHL